jgi:flavin reductase (DIM6/NTAB) family NADH-FMN oxidoreductase RutF
MIIDLEKLDGRERYKLAIGSVIPRPIAWVSTKDTKGRRNLAPFSFFTVACSNPLIFGIFSQRNKYGSESKDTARNILETGEAVIHIASLDQLEALNATAATLPHGVDEFDHAGLQAIAASVVKADVVVGCPIAFECTLHQHVTLGDDDKGSDAIFLKALVMHVEDGIIDQNRIDHHAFKPVSKLAGPFYATIGSEIEIQRPE